MPVEPIEIRDMLYILAVWEERSFSRAAERCYITQPALSRTVKRAEERLGAQIFDRSSVPLGVTPEGQIFVEYFRKMQGLEQELSQYCEELQRRKNRDLNIGAPSFFCTYVLPPLLEAFKLENPEFNVRLIELNDRDLGRLLRAGIVDLGLSVEPSMPTGLSSFVLQEETVLLAVPSDFSINRELQESALSCEDICSGRFRRPEVRAVSLSHFSREKFLFLKKENDMYRRGLRLCREAGFEPDIVMELDQLLSAYYMAENGFGITLIRSSIPYYVNSSGRLLFYKIAHADTRRELRAYYQEGAEKTFQKVFIDYLREVRLPG